MQKMIKGKSISLESLNIHENFHKIMYIYMCVCVCSSMCHSVAHLREFLKFEEMYITRVYYIPKCFQSGDMVSDTQM